MNTLFDEQGTSPGHMSDQYTVKEPSAHTAGTFILIHTAGKNKGDDACHKVVRI
ncbi:hypothetical protein JI435_410790 [Parastagonospora nodorum SN15]|uniref:Uncharacterized protein n=1 Tax=Phaeosphaeria nodorum (strain SN15 / ATCC MYA-4574 / FGSC 10173) TaxID=321614 RepID=A0A7U2F3B7_PHANO|nr:hypothetical protein JI435_410790 [Parastagonospora nodorum SN15]